MTFNVKQKQSSQVANHQLKGGAQEGSGKPLGFTKAGCRMTFISWPHSHLAQQHRPVGTPTIYCPKAGEITQPPRWRGRKLGGGTPSLIYFTTDFQPFINLWSFCPGIFVQQYVFQHLNCLQLAGKACLGKTSFKPQLCHLIVQQIPERRNLVLSFVKGQLEDALYREGMNLTCNPVFPQRAALKPIPVPGG